MKAQKDVGCRCELKSAWFASVNFLSSRKANHRDSKKRPTPAFIERSRIFFSAVVRLP